MVECFVIAIIAFLLFLVLHLLVLRGVGEENFFRYSFLIFCAVFFLYLCSDFFKSWFMGICVAFLFLGLWTSYMVVLTNVLNSVSLYILWQMESQGASKIFSPKDIDLIYDDTSSILERIAVMEKKGLLTKVSSTYDLTPKGRFIAQITQGLRKIFHIYDVG